MRLTRTMSGECNFLWRGIFSVEYSELHSLLRAPCFPRHPPILAPFALCLLPLPILFPSRAPGAGREEAEEQSPKSRFSHGWGKARKQTHRSAVTVTWLEVPFFFLQRRFRRAYSRVTPSQGRKM